MNEHSFILSEARRKIKDFLPRCGNLDGSDAVWAGDSAVGAVEFGANRVEEGAPVEWFLEKRGIEFQLIK